MRRSSSRLGELIRRQRELNRLTLRQFAALAGISNPYLSQIERGLRMPSPEVVQGIASLLKVSTEQLYAEAGLPQTSDDGTDGRASLAAVLEADTVLSARQRRVLLDVYDGLVAANSVPRRTGRDRRTGAVET